MLCGSTIVLGQDVSKSMAIDIAYQYYEQVKNDHSSDRISEIINANHARSDRYPELISPMGRANMWLIPVEDGWVLVSSNTKTTPILAHYQTEEKPVYDSLPPAAKYLLEWYENDIAYANDSCPNCARNKEWDSLLQEKETKGKTTRTTIYVSPLVSTHWDQTNNASYGSYCDKSYNKFCPYVDAPNQCNKAAVGCPAVAIGQIMAYWQWPYSAYVPTTPGGNNTELQFYDWALMPDELYNSTSYDEVNMVAAFLRDCGYMADMNYGVSSGTTDVKAKDALISFGYSNSTISLKQKWLTSGWQTLLEDELNAGRPVYYGGYGSIWGEDGHAFVLDGYNSSGLFHINFGWGGYGDDFYQIDNIVPNGSNYNFNYLQSAIVGIQPAPICAPLHVVDVLTSRPKFCYAVSGEMLLSYNLIENVERGALFSATQVRLYNNVIIRQGCNVHIAIKNVPCPPSTMSGAPSISREPTKETIFSDVRTQEIEGVIISPNPVKTVLHVQAEESISGVKIYSINGQCALQSAQTDIDVSGLPQGMYVLRAITADGQQYQTKFIKE